MRRFIGRKGIIEKGTLGQMRPKYGGLRVKDLVTLNESLFKKWKCGLQVQVFLYQILESRYIVIVEIQMRKLISEKKNYLYSKWIFEKYVEKKKSITIFYKKLEYGSTINFQSNKWKGNKCFA